MDYSEDTTPEDYVPDGTYFAPMRSRVRGSDIKLAERNIQKYSDKEDATGPLQPERFSIETQNFVRMVFPGLEGGNKISPFPSTDGVDRIINTDILADSRDKIDRNLLPTQKIIQAILLNPDDFLRRPEMQDPYHQKLLEDIIKDAKHYKGDLGAILRAARPNLLKLAVRDLAKSRQEMLVEKIAQRAIEKIPNTEASLVLAATYRNHKAIIRIEKEELDPGIGLLPVGLEKDSTPEGLTTPTDIRIAFIQRVAELAAEKMKAHLASFLEGRPFYDTTIQPIRSLSNKTDLPLKGQMYLTIPAGSIKGPLDPHYFFITHTVGEDGIEFECQYYPPKWEAVPSTQS